MNSNKESPSGWDEFQDPRGTPITSKLIGNPENRGKHTNTKNGIVRGDKIDAKRFEDNLTTRGDVVMWEIDDVGFAYTGETSDHLTPGMTTATSLNTQPTKCSGLKIQPSYPTKQVIQEGITGTKSHPHRQIFSPSDARDMYRFRDLFPKPEIQEEITNRLGEINAGEAFVVDSNITMHGDIMMLDLDSDDEGHTGHIYTAAEKLSQLTEVNTSRSVTRPTNAPRTTTGIRHLMSIRNPDLAELPNDSSAPDKKRRRKKRKPKHVKNTKNAIHLSETQDIAEPVSCVVPSQLEIVQITTNKEKKPIVLGFTEKLRYQICRFRAYIQKKIICH